MNKFFSRTILFRTITILVAVLVPLLLLEMAVRWSQPHWTLQDTLKFSDTYFSRHIISPQEQTVKRFSNPNQTLKINKHGYRGDNFAEQKPDTEVRVIIYGGSQVFDHTGKPPGWPDLAEEALAHQGYGHVEIINAGVPGHASFDSYGKLFSHDHYLEPDYIILNNAWNDFKYFHNEKPPIRETPTYRTGDNVRRYYQNSIDRFLGEKSQLYTYLRLYLLEYFLKPGRISGEIDELNEPTDTALRQYRLTLNAFVQFSSEIGAVPVLMTQPRLLTEDVTAEDNKKIAYHYVRLNKKGILESFQQSDRMIQSIVKDSPAILFDASQGMTGKSRYFVDHVHFTSEGSRTIAERFSRKIKKLLHTRKHENQQ